MSHPTISIVGTGPVAHALGRGYTDRGGVVSCIVSRDAARARDAARCVHAVRSSTELADALDADIVIVAVSDSAIASVGEQLLALCDEAGSRGVLTLHTSGALPGAALGGAPLRAGSLHPLQSLSLPSDSRSGGASDTDAHDPTTLLATRLAGVHWFHEGEGAAEARELVGVWRGVFHALAPGGKSLYHAGAAVLSNHTVAVFASAVRLLEVAGVPAAEAHQPLVRLLAGTTANLAEIGLPGALTGPVARGDVGTVAAHVDAISGAVPDLLPSYAELALVAVDVALAKGTLDEARAAALRALLSAVRQERGDEETGR